MWIHKNHSRNSSAKKWKLNNDYVGLGELVISLPKEVFGHLSTWLNQQNNNTDSPSLNCYGISLNLSDIQLGSYLNENNSDWRILNWKKSQKNSIPDADSRFIRLSPNQKIVFSFLEAPSSKFNPKVTIQFFFGKTDKDGTFVLR